MFLLTLESGFNSTIKLVSFDESQVVTFNTEFVRGFRMVIAEPGVRATTRSAAHMGLFKDIKKALLDSNPSQPSASTLVVAEMHKEDPQATGGPTSLGVTSKGGADPQPSSGYDASTNSTTEANPRIYVPNDFIPQQQEKTKSVLTQPTTGKGASDIAKKIEEEFQKEIKLEDLSRLVQDSQKQKLELEKKKAEAEAVFLTALPSYLNVAQLTELLIKSLHLELSNILSTCDFSSSLLTELKELPSKFKVLTKEVKGLKKHVHELEIELPRDLKDIPNMLEIFTSTIKSLTNRVVGLKNLQWELPAEFLSIPTQVESVQAKTKTLDALSSLLNKVTEAFNKFAQVFASASQNTRDTSVPSAGQAGTQPAEGRRTQIKSPSLSYFKEKLHRMLKRLT
ncbi:hypothetical protein Tco_0522369 [Tanacetum coccineum]